MVGFELGIGYVAVPALRLEAVIEHRPNFSFDGRANFVQTAGRQEVSANLSSLSGMLAAYLDLPELGLHRLGPFSPFIGGGVGLSRINIDETLMEFPRTTTIIPSGQRVNLAWMLTAGIAASVAENLTLDIAWRYTDSGAVETGTARGRIVWRDGSRAPLEIDLAGTRANLSSHGLRVSLRYAF
jgi:opacity protein-like surface antigen